MSIILLGAVHQTPANAAMQSATYVIPTDVISVGGVEGQSATFDLPYSISGPGGNATSSSYIIRSGFFGSDPGQLSVTVGTASPDLGTLNASQVNSASSIVTVLTDSATGYTLSVGSVSGSSIAAVADGTVTAGSEEYGVALTGADRAFTNDRAITAGLILASANAPATNGDQTTLTFKASISANTTPGTYSQTITLTASANL